MPTKRSIAAILALLAIVSQVAAQVPSPVDADTSPPAAPSPPAENDYAGAEETPESSPIIRPGDYEDYFNPNVDTDYDDQPSPAPADQPLAPVPTAAEAEEPTAAVAAGEPPAPAPVEQEEQQDASASPAPAPESSIEESIVYNATVVTVPGIILVTDTFAVTDASAALRVTAEATLCDATGTDCSGTASPDDIEPYIVLSCANTGPAINSRTFYYASSRLEATQVVWVSPDSINFIPDDAGSLPTFFCQVQARDYLPYPIQIKLTATQLPPSTFPKLTTAGQAGAAALYDTCCVEADANACSAWKEAANLKGVDPSAAFADLCQIPGCECSPEGELITLDLIGFDLRCDLASIDLAPFPELQRLYLTANNITGDFTDASVRLNAAPFTLKELRVDANPLLGGDLSGGEDNGQEGLCAMIAGGLEQLVVVSTSISGSLPACLFTAGSALKQLFASGSQISGVIPPLQGSTSLQVFQIAFSQLSGEIPPLPPSILKFNVSMNDMEGPLPSLPPSLLMLDVSNNKFTGTVPDTAANHPRLWLLDVRANQLRGLPEQWLDEGSSEQSSLPMRTLLLAHNPLKTEFPKGLAGYASLQAIDLDETELQGELPGLGQNAFANLYALFASNNKELQGSIPDSWKNINIFKTDGSQVSVIKSFIMANNSLSGTLPDWLAGPFSQTIIDLSGNNFGNGCEEAFATLGTCGGDAAKPQGTDSTSDSSDDGDGDGLSTGAVAGIVIALLLVAGGIGGYIFWKKRRHHGNASFQRFEEEDSAGMVEMGNTQRNTVYNPGLAP